MQPTAFGAQDRWFFEAIMCCAPSAAADAQGVRRHPIIAVPSFNLV